MPRGCKQVGWRHLVAVVGTASGTGRETGRERASCTQTHTKTFIFRFWGLQIKYCGVTKEKTSSMSQIRVGEKFRAVY